jgi:hypothetical protein
MAKRFRGTDRGLRCIECLEVARRYRDRDGAGEIGVITSATQPSCGTSTGVRTERTTDLPRVEPSHIGG